MIPPRRANTGRRDFLFSSNANQRMLAAVQKFHGMLQLKFVRQWVLCVCSVGVNHATQKYS